MLKKILVGVAVFLTVSLSAAGIIYATNKSLGRNNEFQNYSSDISKGLGNYFGKSCRNSAGENNNGDGNQNRFQEQDCEGCEDCLKNQECNCEQNRIQKRDLSGNKSENQECNSEENCIRNQNQINNSECVGSENCLRNQNKSGK